MRKGRNKFLDQPRGTFLLLVSTSDCLSPWAVGVLARQSPAMNQAIFSQGYNTDFRVWIPSCR